jgi:hypothetical protein
MDLRRAELLQLALRLDFRISQAVRYQPSRFNRHFRLPTIWAGFSPAKAGAVEGVGEDLDRLAAKFDLPTQVMFKKFERRHDGLVLFPLKWVGEQVESRRALFADLEGLPSRQLVSVETIPCGLVGACEGGNFDFYSEGRSSPRPARQRSTAVA